MIEAYDFEQKNGCYSQNINNINEHPTACVVYFDQLMGAVHRIRWLKYCFLRISPFFIYVAFVLQVFASFL